MDLRTALAVLAVVVLSGCAGSAGTVVETSRALMRATGLSQRPDLISPTPDPRFEYVRVQANDGPESVVVLGYVDPDPSGPMEVWYSPDRQVLRLREGRIVGSAGLEVDWHAVLFTPQPPAWDATSPAEVRYTRTRDQTPGHRYGVSDALVLTPWQGDVPPVALPRVLDPQRARAWRWYQERVEGASSAAGLPPNWFAVGNFRGRQTVLYSQQCLSRDYCLKLLRWPVP